MLHRITILFTLTFTLGGFLIDWNANSISAADPSATTEILPTLTGPAAAEYLRNTEGLDELYNSIATSPEGGGVYTQQQRLTASDGNTGMGLSVAISGNTAVVGARTDAGLRGSAYVFVRSGTTWTEQQKLIPSHASPEASLFGYSVAISGDTIVVGAMASLITGSTGRGSAYVFVRSGTNWTEQARLLAPDAGGEGINFQFGRSVAVDGDMAIVGANGAGPNFRGAAYVFARSAGVWAFDQRLAASDGADNDFFGYSVALAGQTVIIGSFADDDGGEASGSAYVYVRNGTWSEQQKLVPSDPIPSGHFGISVALSGETAVVGSMPLDNFIDPTQGSAYVFTRSGGTWAQAQKLQGCDIDRDLFGGSVAISGDRIVVGREVPSSTPPAMPPGNAYFFDRSGSNWTLRQRIQGGPTALYFGNGVGIASDGTATVGSFRDTGNTDHAAYIYVEQPGTPSAPCPGGTPTPSVTPTPSPIPTPSPTPTITPTPPASPTPPTGGQPAMLSQGITGGGGAIVRYNDPRNAPASQALTQGLPADAEPHGIAAAGNNTVLVGDFNHSRIFVVRASDGVLQSTISTSAAGYNGSGSIAVPPQQNVALASGNTSAVKVIQAPFNAASTITSVTLPGFIWPHTSQAIVFDAAGRAFIRHSTGISVLDPPYTSVAFTINISTGLRPSLAITPDGNTLLATGSNGITSTIFIFNAPFSAASTPEFLPAFSGVDGIKVTPDGSKAIAVSSSLHVASAISAPFTSTSNIQPLPLPAGTEAFEHVDISADGQTAIIAGRSELEPPILIRAPFTTAGATSSNIPVNAANPSRGGGGVVFLPPATTQRTPYDFDGDGRADRSVFRPMPDPAANFWYISKSSDGTSYATEWGIEIDKLTTADYDGDGKADIAVWREDPSDPDRAMFYVLRSSDGQFQIEQFGRTGDVHSVVGDWDGDGKDDVAVYRVTGGQGQFFYRPSSQPGVDFVTINWGTTGDTPVRGDFDGDERSDAAVFRPSDGIWYILQSSNGQPQYRSWGTTGDKLVPADYDGDNKTDPAVFRDGTWYILKSSNGQPSYMSFGTSADTLVPADYDGDGQTDAAVYRNGTWYINQTTSGFAAFNFGLGSDVPVPSAYIGP